MEEEEECDYNCLCIYVSDLRSGATVGEFELK